MIDADRRVKNWLKSEVEKLQTECQKEDWLTLREAMNDHALMSAPNDVFTMHMQFIQLQLLMGCTVKMCSGGIAEMMRNPERYLQHMDELTEPIRDMVYSIENGKDIAAEYSSAYGSSTTKAAAAMIGVLQNKILTSPMSSSAGAFLEQHIVATYVAYKEAIEGVYGSGSRPENPPSPLGSPVFETPVVRKGKGCLVCVVECVIGGLALIQIFRIVLFA